MIGKEGPSSLWKARFYFVGIKGTGMSALAELLHKRGARVTGSDVKEPFYTDAVLRKLEIPFAEGFDARNLPSTVDAVIYSAAYDKETHPELLAAAEKGIPLYTYAEALGMISRLSYSVGIAGVHGKTTTTALCATLLKHVSFPVSVLVGSAVANLDYQSTLVKGDSYFIAETCEYRKHFLSYSPRTILVTNIEPDHLDYFSGYEAVFNAFVEYASLLPEGGFLIYCADDPGAKQLSSVIAEKRPDVRFIPYGFSAEGRFRITDFKMCSGRSEFSVAGLAPVFTLHIPGKHSVVNAAGALAVVSRLFEDEARFLSESDVMKIAEGVREFSGCRRRSELLGTYGGVLFIDDYAHHPTAVKTTLNGLKKFFPGRRLVVDFMSHTYSRTRALLNDFATAFTDADEVILHKIYASAREQFSGSITGRDLFEAVRQHSPNCRYFHEVEEAVPYCLETLKQGDILVTMGAGDNWKVGKACIARYTQANEVKVVEP